MWWLRRSSLRKLEAFLRYAEPVYQLLEIKEYMPLEEYTDPQEGLMCSLQEQFQGASEELSRQYERIEEALGRYEERKFGLISRGIQPLSGNRRRGLRKSLSNRIGWCRTKLVDCSLRGDSC